MKKYTLIIILCSACQLFYGQDKFSNHQLTADFGSFRNRYLYPITDLKYRSPVWEKTNLQFSLRIRSYGTLYFYSKSSYDITPLAEYYSFKNNPIYFSAGMGLDSRIRLVKDIRSEAVSSVEPLISLTLHGNYKKLGFNVPFWTRFYSNGISYTLLPEASCKIGNRVSVFIRYELSFLKVYKIAAREWRQDSFIGTCFYF